MQRSAGILLPISSLPSLYGIGCFSQEAYDFVDWLKEAGQTYWQILPLGVTSYGDSPYQSFSAFAGNPYFISLDALVEEGTLTADECKKANFGRKADDIDYSRLYTECGRLLRLAYTGTHDNETLVSWYQTISDAERAMVRDYLYDYATPDEQLYKSMIALILRSAAARCIIPMQDWLGLDNAARINKPSTVGQNWRWRVKKTQLTKKLQKEICQLTTRYGRMNWA